MDTISDMLTRIRNAQIVRHQSTDIPFSNLKLKIAQILIEENFIKEIKKIKRQEKKFIKVFLKYNSDKSPMISGLKRISKPGQRIYRKTNEMRGKGGGHGITIVSTSKGIMTAKEAMKQKVGGEVICQIF